MTDTGGEKSDAEMMSNLNNVLAKFGVSIVEASDLVALQEYEIVVIADDSGSMRNPAAPKAERVVGEKPKTRWEELKETVAEIVDLGACFDDSGTDVFFLNRAPALKVKSSADEAFVKAFKKIPEGSTPLAETLQQVATYSMGERKILLFILTDGEPNGGVDDFISNLSRLCGSGKLKVQIMACTPDEAEIEWLNEVDKQMKQVDVTDDYYAEKKQVVAAGLVSKFTHGDWVMKAMLGPVDHRFDAWDEKLGKKSQGVCSMCVIA